MCLHRAILIDMGQFIFILLAIICHNILKPMIIAITINTCVTKSTGKLKGGNQNSPIIYLTELTTTLMEEAINSVKEHLSWSFYF